uniref:Uncharacterized protein n=1 Tax=Timema bartmani TaxID=61472 RepID=A0A7R9ETU3_9NEOP|nr:unnamed protein product [Timema bartmani]
MASVKVPEQKVILCGEYGVGKSSLFRRYATNSFVTATDRQSTLGLDHFDKGYKVGGKEIRLWDTGGMERVASITSSYYKFAEAAILVFALDNAASFHVLSQHLLDIVTYAENAKIFLCGNKSDLEGQTPQVTDSDMENFCALVLDLSKDTERLHCPANQKDRIQTTLMCQSTLVQSTISSEFENDASEQCHNLISATYKTSCKTGEGIEEMFTDIAQHLVESNRSRLELQTMDKKSFKITPPDDTNFRKRKSLADKTIILKQLPAKYRNRHHENSAWLVAFISMVTRTLASFVTIRTDLHLVT